MHLFINSSRSNIDSRRHFYSYIVRLYNLYGICYSIELLALWSIRSIKSIFCKRLNTHGGFSARHVWVHRKLFGQCGDLADNIRFVRHHC